MRDRIVETTAELDRETCCPRLANRRRVDGPWHSRPSWCPSCAGTWSGFAQPEERGLAFAGPKGATLRRSNFRPVWNAACAGAGLPGLHFHDLGDVGGTLAAATGASLEELMARLGAPDFSSSLHLRAAGCHVCELALEQLGGAIAPVGSYGR